MATPNDRPLPPLPPPTSWDADLELTPHQQNGGPADNQAGEQAGDDPAGEAPACAGCGFPVDLAEPHTTLASHVEQQRNGTVNVLHAEVASYRHLACGADTSTPAATGATDEEPEDAPEPLFPSLEAWVNGYLVPSITVELGAGMYWCPQWWRHAEALSRLEGIWREWEQHRLPSGAGMSVWWRDHADHHLTALMESSRTPFRQCSPTQHRDHLQPLPSDPAPPGWFGPQ